MKKEVYTLTDGGIIEIDENYIRVISDDGVCSTFDTRGNAIDKPAWRKYFFAMEKKEREIVRNWVYNAEAKTVKQQDFLELVKSALDTENEDFCISTIEPSVNDEGELFFLEGSVVPAKVNPIQWWDMAKKYWPERESNIARWQQLILWYAYRCAMGFWSLSYVADDSTLGGNYWNSPNASRGLELSGKRKNGGFADGVGNTSRLVLEGNGKFAVCGGYYLDHGEATPVGKFEFNKSEMIFLSFLTPAIVIY